MMSNRDKRLIKSKKRMSKKYDILFDKIIEILISYRLQLKEFSIAELNKYNRLTSFNNQIKNLLKDFKDEELELVEEILQEEFKESWKAQQKLIHKRVKMPTKKEINNIVNYRNKHDGLTVEERNQRNVDYLQYKIYSTVTKNATNDEDFDKLINEDIKELKKKHLKKTVLRQLQDDITQSECLSTLYLASALNNKNKIDFVTLVFRTQQDEKVCGKCQDLSNKEFKIGEISIPQDTHPNCRCWLQIKKKEH